jgi:hypothetical protein
MNSTHVRHNTGTIVQRQPKRGPCLATFTSHSAAQRSQNPIRHNHRQRDRTHCSLIATKARPHLEDEGDVPTVGRPIMCRALEPDIFSAPTTPVQLQPRASDMVENVLIRPAVSLLALVIFALCEVQVHRGGILLLRLLPRRDIGMQ